MGKIIKDAAALLVITLVAGFLLGFVYDVTLEPIKDQEALSQKKAYQEVFADAADFKEKDVDSDAIASYLIENGWNKQTIDRVAEAMDGNGEKMGYVITVTDSEGYGGDITFSLGIRMDGTTNGISILSISETAGLGMKADTEDFRNQFKEKKTEAFISTKSGAQSEEEIDALSGATITTNAIVNGVNAGLCAFRYLKGGS